MFKVVSSPARPSLALLVAGVLLALGIARFWFVCDDAFILFRYSKNLAHGLGLTYNPGVPAVEGFSEPLWTVLLAIPERLGLAAPRLAPWITALGSFVLLGRVVAFSARRGTSQLGLLGCGLFVATSPTVAIWSTSGLSMSLSTLLLFLTFSALFDERDEIGRAHV